MNVVKLSAVLATAVLAMAGCAIEGENIETEQLAEMGHGGGHHCEPGAVMIDGDFDGDGTITHADIEMLEAYKDAGDYASFFDVNDDGVLDGQDVAAVALKLGDAAHPRDAQFAALWATIEPYRNIYNAIADGYIPFTPDLYGHGVHWTRLDLVYSFADRGGFDPGLPEGLNYSASGELLAAFYYGLAVTDLSNLNPAYPPGAALAYISPPSSFAGVMGHTWHQHTGACFGRFTQGAVPDIFPYENEHGETVEGMPGLPGFNQCMSQADCESYGAIPGVNQIWSPQFHMLHAWVVKRNECGVFGGIDPNVSHGAPIEPNHGNCELEQVVTLPVVPVGQIF